MIKSMYLKQLINITALRQIPMACCFMGYVILMSDSGCNRSKKAEAPSNVIWHEQLPACPCENPDKNGIVVNDSWAKDVGNIGKYHAGSTECFRSYPPIQTSEGVSGQQCCYDENGKLITGGSAAGTPDKTSTCKGEDAQGVMTTDYGILLGHYTNDVRPWDRFGGVDSGWVQYNKFWVPNNKNGCDTNVVGKR